MESEYIQNRFISSNPKILAFNVSSLIISKNKWQFWSQDHKSSLHNPIHFHGFPYHEPYLLKVDIFLLQPPLKQQCLCMPWVLYKIYLSKTLIVKLSKGTKSSCMILLSLGDDRGWTDPWHQICLVLRAATGVEFLH